MKILTGISIICGFILAMFTQDKLSGIALILANMAMMQLINFKS